VKTLLEAVHALPSWGKPDKLHHHVVARLVDAEALLEENRAIAKEVEAEGGDHAVHHNVAKHISGACLLV
jgi:hypothetical protein